MRYAISAADNDDLLKVLIKNSLEDKGVLAFRSSWTLSKVAAIDKSLMEHICRRLLVHCL
ncbi:MAG: hypothetical protein R2744_13645 [Bacteroidales bacterium]